MVILFWKFSGNTILSTRVATRIYIFSNSRPEFLCVHILANTSYSLWVFFCNTHPRKYEVVFHCGFICISLSDVSIFISDGLHLLTYLLAIYMSSLGKCLFSLHTHFFNSLLWVFCFVLFCWCPHVLWRLYRKRWFSKTQVFHLDNENGGHFKLVNSICEACNYKIMLQYVYRDGVMKKK